MIGHISRARDLSKICFWLLSGRRVPPKIRKPEAHNLSVEPLSLFFLNLNPKPEGNPIVNPRKLEHGFRRIARIPYSLP